MSEFTEKDTARCEKDNNTLTVVPLDEDHMGDTEHASVLSVASDLNATPEEVLVAYEQTKGLGLAELRIKSEPIFQAHAEDPNFPKAGLLRLSKLFDNEPVVRDDPSRDLLEHRLTVGLLIGNSPYSEVRAVVEPTDDPSMPCSTIRAWVIGMVFVILVSFVNQLFSVRQPSIRLLGPVIQLLSYPVGKAAERWLPDKKIFGTQHSLNPGVFNQKEHMLISIMAAVGTGLPHSRYIIFTQWLDQYLGQGYAANFWYQILLALAMNLMGFGLAGLCRRFLVYPAFAIWPKSLVTIALNKALHSQDSSSVPGPFNRNYSATRYKVFILVFLGSFVWFWFPDYIFQAMSFFNWLAWIAPNNFNLATITGVQKGLGVNPLPTFDWNVATYYVDPLVVPFHVTANFFLGAVIGGITIVGLYWTNAYNIAYLPINTNTMFDHTGSEYNVSRILDSSGLLDEAAYQAYSPVYIAASSVAMYWYFFAVYSAATSYAIFFHSHDLKLGFRSLVNSFKKKSGSSIDFEDVHSRLMKSYPEVSELWYLVLNVISVAFGVAAVAGWPTYTSVGTVFFGIALALVFMVPAGIIFATTGIEVEYNVLAEFIGGAWQPGNALAMNFFKGFGYVTVAHALDFSNDLKLAHYSKLPPWHTFWAQIVSAVVSSLVCVGVMNFQITSINGICTSDQVNNFTCPGIESYWTAAVLFGSLGAKKVFGNGGLYVALLSAFPVGLAFPIIVYYATKKLPANHWLKTIHPVVIFTGGHMWSPYNLAYIWPAVIPGWLSMVYVRGRWLAFWSRYNYVLSAALSTGIAIAAVIIFFAVSYNGYELNWWGNAADTGCESTACTRLSWPDDGTYFGPRMGTYPV